MPFFLQVCWPDFRRTKHCSLEGGEYERVISKRLRIRPQVSITLWICKGDQSWPIWPLTNVAILRIWSVLRTFTTWNLEANCLEKFFCVFEDNPAAALPDRILSEMMTLSSKCFPLKVIKMYFRSPKAIFASTCAIIRGLQHSVLVRISNGPLSWNRKVLLKSTSSFGLSKTKSYVRQSFQHKW